MQDISRTLAVIILAAGLGKRMKSHKAKVLHEIAGKPMLYYVIDAAVKLTEENVYVVVGFQSDIVQISMNPYFNVHYVSQEQQLGTGHAVSCAIPFLPESVNDVIILCGDTPLIQASTLNNFLKYHQDQQNDITLLAVNMLNPAGYGRLLMDTDRRVTGIVEEADANSEQRKLTIVNAGIYCMNKQFLKDSLGFLDTRNAQHEMYLTDVVGIGHRLGKKVGALISEDSCETIGINSQEDLKVAEIQMLRQTKS